ncbi:hypothetical protein [Massilia pseudoviolaceinigra]|nr:hypothetical protein [Massilia sp. CCM 9206]MDQ1923443.1 hypothetical protein [Massilia sp. CCM 9206]
MTSASTVYATTLAAINGNFMSNSLKQLRASGIRACKLGNFMVVLAVLK